jgi:dynactin complex subunit
MDGTVNGETLFECKSGHGLLLRTTQIKVIASPPGEVSLVILTDANI